ncbi:MAG: ISNCY family transposase, partial [Armatimonadota bacterium]|nr:ISNCY family transposase [Armatimonadota bacterium]
QSDNVPMERRDTGISQRDLSRHHVLRMVLENKLALSEAARTLGVSYRHAKRLRKKLLEGGVSGLLHGNLRRDPANKTSEELKSRVLALSTEKYKDFNDSHFFEMLRDVEGIEVSRETVRAIRRGEGIKPKVKRKPRKHHKRRPRKESEGLMMLWDGSPHRWFGEGTQPCCLMAAIDDARSKALALFFVDAERSWAYLELLRRVTSSYGVPSSVYQDRHSSLKRNDSFWSIEEELAGRQDPTQVGAALEALGIEPIFAVTPQAKGRVERLFKTLQDRLVAMLRLEGITDIEQANAYIQEFFLDYFNNKFAVAAENTQNAWRKLPKSLDMERVLSLRYDATVGNDNAIRFAGMVIDIEPGPNKRSYAGVRAELRQTLDGGWRVYHQDKLIAMAPPTEIVEPIRTRNRRKGVKAAHDSNWVYLSSAQPRQDETYHATARTAKGTARRAGNGSRIGATRIA